MDEDLRDEVVPLVPPGHPGVDVARTPRVGGPLPECVVGRELALSPFVDAGEVAVHGLAGAVVTGSSVRWTPPHPGRFEVVFVALPDKARPNAFSTRTETVVRLPARA